VSKPADERKFKTEDLSRRDFLKRVGCASALALAAGGLGWVLFDSQGPLPVEPQKALTGLGDFTSQKLGAEQGKMAIVRGADRGAMIERGLKALGGMEAFIQKGDRVLIKVNAAFATPASLGATTHPETLAAVAGLCFQAGAAQVVVTDNPINNPDSCFEISGLAEAARATGARIIGPRASLFSPLSLPGGRLIQKWPVLAGPFQGINKVIIASPVKDHQRARASMTLKNLYGFLGGRRNVFPPGHQRHHHRTVPIAQAHPVRPGRHGEHDDQRPHRRVPVRSEGHAHHGALHRPGGRRRGGGGTVGALPGPGALYRHG
jgi:hypothetical protein